jgi:hypothetical protein
MARQARSPGVEKNRPRRASGCRFARDSVGLRPQDARAVPARCAPGPRHGHVALRPGACAWAGVRTAGPGARLSGSAARGDRTADASRRAHDDRLEACSTRRPLSPAVSAGANPVDRHHTVERAGHPRSLGHRRLRAEPGRRVLLRLRTAEDRRTRLAPTLKPDSHDGGAAPGVQHQPARLGGSREPN